MEKIEIKNFCQFKEYVFILDKNFYVITGEQASGKSTLCKVVYFCKKIKEYLVAFILEIENVKKSSKDTYYSLFLKTLIGKFIECFGSVNYMDDFSITYYFNNNYIKICNSFDKTGKKKLKFYFDNELRNFFNYTLDNYRQIMKDNFADKDLWDFYSTKSYFDSLKIKLRLSVNQMFGNDFDCVYIPAGRSLLATLSDQFNAINLNQIDLVMKEFIHLIQATKDRFGSGISGAIDKYLLSSAENIKNVQLMEAEELASSILHAVYTNSRDGEKMFFDDEHWVKLVMASSGQQEALWIVLLLFTMILENKKYFVIIEEPEAHLFPEGQFYTMKLISLFLSSTSSKVIMTTHSPYILSSLNSLIISYNRGDSLLLKKRYKINKDLFEAYAIQRKITGSEVQCIKDSDGLIDFNYIDSILEVINKIIDES